MPKFESFTRNDQDIDRGERTKLVEKYLEQLKQNLKDEADLLREDGIPVDDECKIDIDQFVGKHSQYTPAFIDKTKKNFANLEDKFKKGGEANPRLKDSKNIGELLEIVKTLLFNQDLFGGRLKVVRTSRADDIQNGIDEIAFDIKTGLPIGVIDVTTGVRRKDNINIKMKIGGKLDFGLEMPSKDGKTLIVPRPLSELPLYIFEMRLDNILEIARAKATGSYDEDVQKTIKSIEENTLSRFIYDGIKILSDENLSENMRAKYEQANKVFQEIIDASIKKI